jgi:hypothetical protein
LHGFTLEEGSIPRIPLLKGLLVRRTPELVNLRNEVALDIRFSDRRSVRDSTPAPNRTLCIHQHRSTPSVRGTGSASRSAYRFPLYMYVCKSYASNS